MSKSSIEWTEETWNPIVGCSIVSPGCTNCYAMKTAARNEAMGISRYDGTTRKVNGNTVWTGKLAQAPVETLLAPLRRKKPTTYFVNSMGDLFHEDVPDEWIDRVFAVIGFTDDHIYQILTKRADRQRDYMADPKTPERIDALMREMAIKNQWCKGELDEWPPKNAWLGVSTERQHEADERIPLLLDTPAAVRFSSVEPALGPIDLTNLDINGDGTMDCLNMRSSAEHWREEWAPAVTGTTLDEAIEAFEDWGFSYPPTETKPRGIDWVIVGGESGPNARPMHPDWARSLRDQCQAAGVAFFFKQWGEWAPIDAYPMEPNRQFETLLISPDGKHISDGDAMRSDFPDTARYVYRVGKKKAGRLLDGIEHNAMPVRP